MKVILLQNIPKIGQKGDVKNLKDGFVRNNLLPKGLAKVATPAELKKLEGENLKNAEYQNQEVARTAEIFRKMDGQIVEIAEKKNEKGHLFAKVGKSEVLDSVYKNLGIKIKEEWLEVAPIKEVGDYKVILKSNNLERTFIVRII